MIALIDYGVGNLLSVAKALESVGGQIELVDKPADLARAAAVVLPGVGNFGDGMEHLNHRGLTPAVLDFIKSGKPFLGICLGMQLLLESSEEAPGMPGLGVFKGKVVRFPDGPEKVPHMGWNSIMIRQPQCSNLKQVANGSFFYFVHSYYARPEDASVVAASCSYMLDFAAILARDNVFATQFHPEKSQNCGLAILRNFVANAGRTMQ